MEYKCKKCGRRLMGTEKFCTACGTPNPLIQDSDEKRLNILGLILIVLMCLIVVTAFSSFIAYRYNIF